MPSIVKLHNYKNGRCRCNHYPGELLGLLLRYGFELPSTSSWYYPEENCSQHFYFEDSSGYPLHHIKVGSLKYLEGRSWGPIFQWRFAHISLCKYVSFLSHWGIVTQQKILGSPKNLNVFLNSFLCLSS